MDKTAMVKNLRSPYASIAKQLECDYDLACCFESLQNADHYDWSQMMPKVTYDEWMVCLYKCDNKLYYIDFDQCTIKEVVVAEILQYDDQYRPVGSDGCVVDDDKLPTYCQNVCCGESDCMTCYIYFDCVN